MKRILGTSVASVMVVLALLAAYIPPAVGAGPGVVRSTGAGGGGLPHLQFVMSPTFGDAIIVFEFFGANSAPCNSILLPTDSQSQTWAQIGNCITDGSGSAMKAFSIASYSSHVADTISCNYGIPNTAVESCYLFDITNPGATITLLASASGPMAVSSFGNVANTGSFTASPNALILATVGTEPLCNAGVMGTSGYTMYTPPQTCGHYDSQFSQTRGMTGMYQQIGSGGLTTDAPMIFTLSSTFIEMVVQITAPTVTTTTTSYTATITGWLVPDAAHLANTLLLMLLPLVGMVFFTMPLVMARRKGDVAVYACLGGMLAGSVLADLPANPSNVLQIPFAYIVVSGLLLFLWWWQS